VLVLRVRPDPDELGQDNCLVLDMPDGSRVRVWVTESNRFGVKFVIDAPLRVKVTRGKLLGPEAAEYGVSR
jgi:hypothetical protein